MFTYIAASLKLVNNLHKSFCVNFSEKAQHHLNKGFTIQRLEVSAPSLEIKLLLTILLFVVFLHWYWNEIALGGSENTLNYVQTSNENLHFHEILFRQYFCFDVSARWLAKTFHRFVKLIIILKATTNEKTKNNFKQGKRNFHHY